MPTPREFPRPRVVMSACLEMEACRHDGQKIHDRSIRAVMEHVDVVPICPEVEIGLGVPRDAIRLVASDERTKLMQPKTGLDLTEKMTRFASSFVEGLSDVDGFVLKSGSPSCGTKDIKVYGGLEKAPTVRKEAGMFARVVQERFPQTALEEEGRLRNANIRHHFLTRLFSLTELRCLGEELKTMQLVDFQGRYKHLLLLYDQQKMRELGRIVANADGAPAREVYETYRQVFAEALNDPPKRGSHINALQHMFGHFSDRLSEGERGEFLRMLDEMRDHQMPLNALIAVLRQWCARYDYDYLADQAYLEPYPRALVQMRDSGKGLDF